MLNCCKLSVWTLKYVGFWQRQPWFLDVLPGSVPDPWHLGTDPDAALFVSDLKDANPKKILCYLFEGTFTLFFKNNKSKIRHKTVEKIKVFLNIFAFWLKAPGPKPDLYWSGSGRVLSTARWLGGVPGLEEVAALMALLAAARAALPPPRLFLIHSFIQ